MCTILRAAAGIEQHNTTPSRSAYVRHDCQVVISLGGQPRFVTSPAPFPFLDLRRQPLVPVLRQVPEHRAALPHWLSHLVSAVIGEELLSAPSTWFRYRGVLLAHPRNPGTAMVRERREIFLSLSQWWGNGILRPSLMRSS